MSWRQHPYLPKYGRILEFSNNLNLMNPSESQFSIDDQLKMTELHLEQIDRLAEILKEVDDHPCFDEQSFLSISQEEVESSPYPTSYAMIAELIMMHPKMKCINIPE